MRSGLRGVGCELRGEWIGWVGRATGGDVASWFLGCSPVLEGRFKWGHWTLRNLLLW